MAKAQSHVGRIMGGLTGRLSGEDLERVDELLAAAEWKFGVSTDGESHRLVIRCESADVPAGERLFEKLMEGR
jgi:hypothetical protein